MSDKYQLVVQDKDGIIRTYLLDHDYNSIEEAESEAENLADVVYTENDLGWTVTPTTEQQNWSKPRPEDQTQMVVNGELVWIDNDFVVLITELNRLGLITRSHCAGHTGDNAWIAIRTDSIRDIEVRWWDVHKEIVINWKRPEEKTDG